MVVDLAGWRAEWPAAPLTRFAPAPTGFLHLGHVANAVYVWGLARALGGRVLLRVEDHDRQRCRPEFEQALLDDLDWLGFVPDLFPSPNFRAGRCDGRQSDRDAVYREAAAALAAEGWLFGCDCTRRELQQHASGGDSPLAPPAELRYGGRCRTRGLPLEGGLGWRLRMGPGIEVVEDLALGPQPQDPASQCGDLLIRDRLGNWTYQFAVSVDDMRQGVTLVIRGVDLLSSSGRQVRLGRLLGRPAPPTFVHHPLVLKSPTRKLSKSDGDTGIRDVRAAGWTPARVIGHAAWRVGLQPDDHPVAAVDVGKFFR